MVVIVLTIYKTWNIPVRQFKETSVTPSVQESMGVIYNCVSLGNHLISQYDLKMISFFDIRIWDHILLIFKNLNVGLYISYWHFLLLFISLNLFTHKLVPARVFNLIAQQDTHYQSPMYYPLSYHVMWECRCAYDNL